MAKRRKKRGLRTTAPILLAADTSTLHQSVAITDGSRSTLAEVRLAVARGHSPNMLAVIDQLLTHTQLSFSDIDALVIGLGPGSFTGLRVGLACFKALALAHDLPLFGGSSLAATAATLATPGSEHLICPVMDARKAEVYAALYAQNADGTLEARMPETVIAPRALAEEFLFAAPGEQPIIFAGTGVQTYRETLASAFGERAVFATAHPSAMALAHAALPGVHAGTPPALDGLEPRYIRPSEAEIAAAKRAENS